MKTSVQVFEQIKTMDGETLHPKRHILLKELSSALSLPQDELLVFLVELEDRGLVKIHKTTLPAVSLTNYGTEQDKPS